MTTKRLIEHRNATLDIYRRLREARNKAGKEIPDSIAKSQNNLDQQRFLLAIIGKVKAGKSTFINALLTDDLLPTDSLQATAAIIEIFHSDKTFLRVTYANEQKEEITPGNDEDYLAPLTKKLREVAAIQSDERDLPIAQLNDFIIDQYNPDSNQAEWGQAMLESFIEVVLPKSLELPPGEWQHRSKAYLENHRDGAGVAKCIEVGYPSDYQFDHFRIVDTPGICAKGGFAERTLDFLNKADAVIYLHKDEPSEKSLHEALQNIIPEKAKKHMLLVLTHKCERDDEENQRFLTEAKRACPQIPPEQIFLVDSLTDRALQTFYDHKSWDDIANLRRQDTKTHKGWKKVTAEAFEDACGNRALLLELLENQSNMSNLKKTILRMSEKSLGLQIETVLSNIVELYGELEADATARRDLYRGKLKDPQQFAAEMTKQKQEMDELEAESAKRVRCIEIEFNLDNKRQKFGCELDTIIKRAEDEINGKEFLSDDTTQTANDYLTKIRQDVTDNLTDLVKEIKDSFSCKISQMESALQLDFDITVPKIPLSEILDEVRNAATETRTRSVEKLGFWNGVKRLFRHNSGWSTEEYKALNAQKYFSIAQTRFVQELLNKKEELAGSVKRTIGGACVSYQESVREKLDHRRELISKLENDQQANEDVRMRLEEESHQVEAAKNEIAECVRIKGDI